MFSLQFLSVLDVLKTTLRFSDLLGLTEFSKAFDLSQQKGNRLKSAKVKGT